MDQDRKRGSSGANYIVSKGSWDQEYSLELSGGCLRWAIGGLSLCKQQKPLELHRSGFTLPGSSTRGQLNTSMWMAPWWTSPNDARRCGPSTIASGSPRSHEEQTRHAGGREVAVATPHPRWRLLQKRMVRVALSVTLKPGATVTVATAILGDLDAKDDRAAAREARSPI